MKRLAVICALALAALAFAVPAQTFADNSFTGTWACTASGEGPNADQTGHFTLVLTESNGTVTGTYYGGTATLTGTRTGNSVNGTFKEPSSSGIFSFTLSDDGKSFGGGWGQSPGRTAGAWNGTRQ